MATDDPVADAIESWLEAREAGRAVSPDTVIRAHPGIADDLRRAFRALSDLEAAPGSASEHAQPPALRRLDPSRYRNFRRVGAGGMGVVFVALDTELDRAVAFKVARIPPSPADAAFEEPFPLASPERAPEGADAFEGLRRRFLREARITGGMAHPGILPVYEVGETPNGVPYYTMRFVHGGVTIAQRLEQMCGRPLDERLPLLETLLKVCDTLDYAHAHGVVHGDLKPENVILGSFGEVVVLDWGLARMPSEPPLEGQRDGPPHTHGPTPRAPTAAGAGGTPGYMAPEALTGGAIDARIDVYALGTMLFELLAGRLPFDAPDAGAYARRVLTETAPDLCRLDPGIPGALADLCARCLARDPADRPAGAREVSGAIRAWQTAVALDRRVADRLRECATALAIAQGSSGIGRLERLERAALSLQEVLHSRPDDPEVLRLSELHERLRADALRQSVRHARRRTLVAVGTVVLVAAASAGVLFTRALTVERDTARDNLRRAERAEAATTAQLRVALMAQARSARLSTLVGRRSEALEALRRAAAIEVTPDLADEARAVLGHADLPLARRIPIEGPRVVSVAIHAARDRLAYGLADGRIVVGPLSGEGEPLTLGASGRRVVWSLLFSPDGRHLAGKFEGEEHLHVWDASDGRLLFRDVTSYPRDAMDFDPTGGRIAVARPNGRVDLLRTSDGVVTESKDLRVLPHRLRFAPDGRRLAVASEQQSRVEIVPLDGSAGLSLRLPAGCRGLAWSPDGSHLALGCADGQIYTWQVADSPGLKPRLAVQGHQAAVTEVVWLHGGDLLLSCSWDGTLRVVDPWTGRERVRVTGGENQMALGADDALLATIDAAGRAIHLRRVEPARLARRLATSVGSVRACALSDDGRRVAVAGDAGAEVLELEEGRVARRLTSRSCWSAQFDAAGHVLTSGAEGVLQWPSTGEGPPTQVLAAPEAARDTERLVLSADGRSVAVAVPVAGRSLVGRRDGTPPREFLHGRVWSVALASDGRYLATAAWNGRAIRLWDTSTGSRVAERGADAEITLVAMSADDRWVVAVDAASIRVLATPDLDVRATLRAPPVHVALACHPREPWVAVAEDSGRIRLLRLPDLEAVLTIEPEIPYVCSWLAFSRSGDRLVSAGGSGAGLTVFDLAGSDRALADLGVRAVNDGPRENRAGR